MISSSYSRRLAGVSGMTVIVFAAETRRSCACCAVTACSASSSVRLAQVDRQRLVAELRIEDHVDVGEVADRGEDVADAGVAEDERVGQRHVRGQLEAGRLQIARRFRPASGAASCRRSGRRAWRAAGCAARAARVSMSPLAGFSSAAICSSISASSSLPVPARRRARWSWYARRAELGALQRQARRQVVGLGAQRLLVLDDGAVEVLGALGFAAGLQAGGRRAAGQARRPAARRRAAATARRRQALSSCATTSAPRGIVKANFASARPTFSLRWVKMNVDVPPWRVAGDQHAQRRGSRDRPRASGGRTRAPASSAPAPARRCRPGRPRWRRAATA